jgi:hypothetical protein
MQRALVVISMLALVLVAVAIGTFAAHGPFWRRAWQWQTAPQFWPGHLAGPARELRPAPHPSPLSFVVDEPLRQLAQHTSTQLLLVAAPDMPVRSYFAAGFAATTRIDGRGLTGGLLAPLYGVLMTDPQPVQLDQPIGAVLTGWGGDRRGAITARQLLWELSGLGGRTLRPFDPFSARAQLASGPSFERAALNTRLRYPPGTHYAVEPANTQLLAMLAGKLRDAQYASLLESRLWRQLAAHSARGVLDHRRGALAAHCCFEAAAEDWLRLALLLANDGRSAGRQLLAAGYVDQMAAASPVHPGQGLGYKVEAGAGGRRLLVRESTGRLLVAVPGTGRALLWAGDAGPSPALRNVLLQAISRPADSASGN